MHIVRIIQWGIMIRVGIVLMIVVLVKMVIVRVIVEEHYIIIL